jgi:hypothetical protein
MEIVHVELANPTGKNGEKKRNSLNNLKSGNDDYLSDKRSEVVVLEVLWKNLLRELIHLLHDESVPLLVPRNDV